MKHIKIFNTTQEYNDVLEELNLLDHYLVFDKEAGKFYSKSTEKPYVEDQTLILPDEARIEDNVLYLNSDNVKIIDGNLIL